ncbi:MAG: apolipoprotein N-acyltransferase [Phycisphaerales bacterium]|nr:apolipoprotein N-acyltransferase [Phycisphaerales bacterium]
MSRPIPSALLAGLFFALLTWLSFPPFGHFWWLAFLAPVPLIACADRRAIEAGPATPAGTEHGRPRRTSVARSLGFVLAVSLGVLPLWLYELQWVIPISAFGYLPMAVIMALFYGVFAWALARVRRRWPRVPLALAAGVVWVGVEFFRGDIACTGFGWMLLGHPLVEVGWLAAPAAVLGAYFVSGLVAAVGGALAAAMAKRYRAAVASIVCIALVWAGAAWLGLLPRLEDGQTTPVTIGVVQTNLAQDNKTFWSPAQRLADMTRFEDLTRSLAGASPRPDLVVWPETMFPGWYLDPVSSQAERDFGIAMNVKDENGNEHRVPSTVFMDRLLALQREIGLPMLVGGVAGDNVRFHEDASGIRDTSDAKYNSALLVERGAVDPHRYDKIELTPFGEVLPYFGSWAWLREWGRDNLGAAGMLFDLTPGRHETVFSLTTADGARYHAVTPICFEATRGRLCRRLVNAAGPGPVVIINLTNDGWFSGFDPARDQHLLAARWRCVELGVPMVRAANTGVSCAIDAGGRVTVRGTSAGEYRVDGTMSAGVGLTNIRTIYRVVGDVVGWASLIATLGLVVTPRRRAVTSPEGA